MRVARWRWVLIPMVVVVGVLRWYWGPESVRGRHGDSIAESKNGSADPVGNQPTT